MRQHRCCSVEDKSRSLQAPSPTKPGQSGGSIERKTAEDCSKTSAAALMGRNVAEPTVKIGFPIRVNRRWRRRWAAVNGLALLGLGGNHWSITQRWARQSHGRMNQITVETDLFEHREVKAHFINPCCFGEDFATWLKQDLLRFPEPGLKISEPIQEDYGWGLWVSYRDDRFWIALSYVGDGPQEAPAQWLISVIYDPGIS
jgi:hypothetical protein